jgi:hypothetical protein
MDYLRGAAYRVDHRDLDAPAALAAGQHQAMTGVEAGQGVLLINELPP